MSLRAPGRVVDVRSGGFDDSPAFLGGVGDLDAFGSVTCSVSSGTVGPLACCVQRLTAGSAETDLAVRSADERNATDPALVRSAGSQPRAAALSGRETASNEVLVTRRRHVVKTLGANRAIGADLAHSVNGLRRLAEHDARVGSAARGLLMPGRGFGFVQITCWAYQCGSFIGDWRNYCMPDPEVMTTACDSRVAWKSGGSKTAFSRKILCCC